MKLSENSSLHALIAKYLPYEGPNIRLFDLEILGFAVTQVPHNSSQTYGMPVGHLLATPPVVEEKTYGQVIELLRHETMLTVDNAVISKIRELFDTDNRYCEYELQTRSMTQEKSYIALVQKGVATSIDDLIAVHREKSGYVGPCSCTAQPLPLGHTLTDAR